MLYSLLCSRQFAFGSIGVRSLILLFDVISFWCCALFIKMRPFTALLLIELDVMDRDRREAVSSSAVVSSGRYRAINNLPCWASFCIGDAVPPMQRRKYCYVLFFFSS